MEFANNGHIVTGFETSREGIKKAQEMLTPHIDLGHITLRHECFLHADIPSESCDLVFSHRSLHLLEDEDVDIFLQQVLKALRPQGFLCVSARDERDFNPDQMIKTSPCSAEYKPAVRQGHIIRFWNKEAFHQRFAGHFDILELIEDNEIESLSNPLQQTQFTLMVAQKI